MFSKKLGIAQLVVLFLSLIVTSAAGAHAELLQASPRADSTVGGEFHSIALQFGGFDADKPYEVHLYDPDGNEIDAVLARELQRVVIPIDPLTAPGVYTVTYEVNGVDGDFSSGSFVFTYDPAADPPQALTVDNGPQGGGFDLIGFGLLVAMAAIAGFLVHRFRVAWREHRSAQQAMTAAASLDDAGEVDHSANGFHAHNGSAGVPGDGFDDPSGAPQAR